MRIPRSAIDAHIEAGYEEIDVDRQNGAEKEAFFCDSCIFFRGETGSCNHEVLKGRADGYIKYYGCCTNWSNYDLTTYSYKQWTDEQE